MWVRRGSKASGGLFVAALVVSLAMPGTASADEFVLGIELGSDMDESEFMAGFQQAVDESPDVSHPPGGDGGDHLGSIDVTVTLDAVGPPVVVIDTSSENFESAFASADSSDAMRIVFVDNVPNDLPQSTGLVVISRDEAAAIAVSESPSFESDFVAGHGRPPTADAARGYAAGKLVDIAVEATDRDPTDVVVLRAALDSALGVENQVADTASPAVVDLPSGGSATNWPSLFGAPVILGALIGSVLFGWWRRVKLRT